MTGAVLAILVGDFDHDGHPDIAGLDIAGRVLTFRNDGSGGFEESGQLATGATPIPFTSGDIDGDGHIDLITGDIGSASLSVFYGRGDGSFEDRMEVPGVFARFLATGDFDADQRADLIAAGDFSGRVSIFYGSAARDLTDPRVLSTPVTRIHVLAPADLNDDGHQDLAVWARDPPYLVVYEGNGSRNFIYRSVTGADFAPGSDPLAAEGGDFDDDGRTELLTSHSVGDGNGPAVSRFHIVDKNPATGDYEATRWGEDLMDLLSSRIIPTDIDANRVPDVILVGGEREGTGSVAIVPNAVNASFAACQFALSSAPELLVPSSAGADFDGNGSLDIVASLFREDVLEIIFSPFDFCGGIVPCYELGPSAPAEVDGAFLLASGEFDRRRSGDEVLVLGSGDGRVLSFAAEPPEELASFSAPLVSHGLAVRDVDGDARSDFAYTDFAGGSVELRLVREGQELAERTLAISPESLPAGIVFAHLDDDAFVDIAVALVGADRVAVLHGAAEVEFSAPRMIPAGERPFALSSGDVNGDGEVDVVAAARNSPVVTVLPGTGDRNEPFGEPIPIDGSDVASAVAAADLDGNGRDDIVALSFTGEHVTAWMSFDDGFVAKPVGRRGEGAPRSLVIRDFDADERAELIVARSLTREIKLYEVEAGGDLAVRKTLSLPEAEDSDAWIALGAGTVAGGDLPDIVVGDRSSGNVLLYAALGCRGTPERTFRRGDADSTGSVEITDAVRTLGVLFLGDGDLSCPDAADTNDDGSIDITDPIATLSFLFLGGPPPAPPGHEACGPDSKSDELASCDAECR